MQESQASLRHSLLTSLLHSPQGHCRIQRQPTTEVVTRHTPRRLLCFSPAPSVFARLRFLRSSARFCLLRLCRPGLLGSAVPRLSLPPPRASSASASPSSSCWQLFEAQLVPKLCSLSPVACSATVNTATTPSWKIVPDSVSGFLLLLLRRLLVESLKKGLGFCAEHTIPMEAQQILSRFCPKPSSLLLPSHKKLHTLPCVGLKNLGIQRLGCSYTEGKKKRVFCVRRTIGEEAAEVKVGATMPARRKKLAVFVSGGGSNFKSIHEASLKGLLHGDVLVLVTNKHDCGGAEYARNNGIPVVLFPKVKDGSDGLSPSELVDTLRSFQVDFILLAGFLKLIPVELIQAYEKSILNIHPSLLPAFGGKGYYGLKVHKAVIASGARYSGPTIHFVDEHYDTGRILAQRAVPVLANDTAEELASRVLKEEHRLYVEVVEALCEERIVWREDGVPLIRSKDNPNEFC
ncbi:hypothetical protein Ahy_A06g028977 isoform B [Arachis hypogaea]|uniref:Phosphoribosylglycinamide formyltransferase, chloroplastic n=2 Tax=Arachis hypogaea TaxID=3818 RepID=A0A445CS38_ARAHY|nr:hypothetical protein Ahy_A06g028977 isoform B [Arachis hypogaea]